MDHAFGSRLQHPRSHGVKGLGYGRHALDVPRALHHPTDFLDVGARFLHPDDVRVLGQFDHHFGGNVVGGKHRNVIDHHRQLRSVGDHTIERQEIGRLHLLAVEVWRADERHVVSQLRGVFGEPQRLAGRFHSCARNQDLMRSRSLPRRLQDIAPLLVGKQDGFPI